MRPRAAATGELDHLAIVWYEGWRDAHEGILPTELTRARTLESFRERLQAALQQVRVVGPPGTPLGFSLLKDDELHQLYVAREGRGTGLAAALVADAEDRLAKSGFETAWLACAIGNARAARFYEKCGWRRTGAIVYTAETSSGGYPLDVWRYEKLLTPPDAPGIR